MADPDMAQLIAGANAAVAAVDSDAAFNAEMADIDLAVVDEEDEEDLGAQLLELNKDKDKNISRAQEDAEFARLEEEAAVGEGKAAEGDEEEEEELIAELEALEQDENQNLTAATVDAQIGELDAQIAADDDEDVLDIAIPEVQAEVGAKDVPQEHRGWIHRWTGFSTNRIPGWRRMRAMTGMGRRKRKRTRKRRRKTRKKRTKRRRRKRTKRRHRTRQRRRRNKRRTRRRRRTRR